MPVVKVTRFDGPLAGELQSPAKELELYWLGQSGFLFRTPELVWVIDPYLSDSLAAKYRGNVFSHERMEPPPIAVHELPRLDYVLCTHIHGDHLDVPTLEAIGQNQTNTRFILPAGISEDIAHLGVGRDRFIWAEAAESIALQDQIDVVPVKAAHEEFEYDQRGRHRFLGYVFQCGPMTLYHSGDCVPYEGLPAQLRALRPDIAMLPVNGRRKELTDKNIVGNFSLAEAIDLCLQTGVSAMIAQHFGLFAFNTLNPELIDQAAIEVAKELQLLKAEAGTRYTFSPRSRA
jgi:L-ascorbate metabolism protein UlaG (beta-lactamase superfamily)